MAVEIIWLSLIAISGQASGQLNCPGETQREMTQCAAAEYQLADAEMTRLYRGLPRSPELLAAQRAWLAYRDAQCKYEHHATPEGSMYSMEESMCLTRLTEQRSEVLARAAEEGYGSGD